MKPEPSQALPILHCAQQADWFAWLEEHHAASPGAWLKLAKKGSEARSLTYDEAIEAALCFGWIDGQKQAQDAKFWRQQFTRRAATSIWSKINKAKALALVEAGRMKPAGLSEIARAKHDGRWDAAYDSASTATVPEDFQSALDSHPSALAYFQTLDSRNRYALLFRIQTAKKAETRAARIAKFVRMLEQHEKLHP
ncbi:MAG: YdeI/OmpD-associated family protein [Thiomonas sp.]|nr:YdeI/OmpD-associated family protein [Thiomonas sp.]